MEMFKIEAVWRGGGERRKLRRQSQQSDSRNSPLTAQSQYFTESRPISTQGSNRNPAPSGRIITTGQQSLPHPDDLVDVSRLSSAEIERQQFEQEEDEWYFGDRLEEMRCDIDNRRSMYVSSCGFLGVQESVSIDRSLTLSECCLRYNLLSDNHIKCLSVSLMHNSTVKVLDLRSCGISLQSCQYICEMLEYNHCITNLDLSENALGTAGLLLLVEWLPLNLKLETLFLDYNDFKDDDSEHISQIIQESTILKYLSLRGNHFSVVAGTHLHTALTENDTLAALDLSWNQLRLQGAVLLCHGLSDNSYLKDLDLSWNGLGLQGCIAMARCLKTNTILQNLDLSANRITREAFQFLLQGLFSHSGLVSLKIGDNPITTEGVMDFMNLLHKSDPENVLTKFEEIDFADICVGADFSDLYTDIRKSRPILMIKHGAAVRQDDLIKIDFATVIHSEQPVFILFDCMRKSNLRIVDLFHAFDKDRSNSLTRQELREGLLSMNIPLSSRALDLLMKHTDTNHDGEISLTELMAVQKDYHKFLSKKRIQKEGRTKSAAGMQRRAKTPVNKA